MWPEDFCESIASLPDPSCGNCKRCMFKSGCGHKNKKEASWCDKYRPEIKNKRKKKKR